MKFIPDKKFKDINLILFNSFKDKRGTFTRLFCHKKLNMFKLNQINLSKNIKKQTLRGIHFQTNKYAEDKIINCISVKIFFVAVNLDKKTKNYLHYFSIILSENDNKAIFIPKTYGTAFMTLKDNSNILYFMSKPYNPKFSRGLKYDDKLINIKWPYKPKVISKKDNNLKYIK